MEREAGEKVDESLSVADPAMWKEDGGPSFAERLAKCDQKNPNAIVGPRFKPADNSRVQGWQQMYDRLKWQETDHGQPMLYVVDACHDWWRTVPALMHDETKPEDLDSRMEDHAADETRYACMARPVSRVPKPRQLSGPKPFSLDWVMAQR